MRYAFDPCPENAREEPEPAHRNRNRGVSKPESGFQLFQPVFPPFADELCGDVQVGDRAPANGRQRLQFRHKSFERSGGLRGKIEAGEQTHNDGLEPILTRAFYSRPTAEVARGLLGKLLVHGETAGTIIETEAYLGGDDLASHSARGITPRTKVIFGPPGHAYVYLNYGIHECLNIVAEPDGVAGCVLIRALEPVRGLELMRARRPKARNEANLASGPGKLTLAMGITRALNGADVTAGPLTVREPGKTAEFEIVTTPRIGITKCADWPLRFLLKPRVT